MKKSIPDRYFYFLIASMGIYLAIRLFDQSRLLRVFPLDSTNDISSFMALLYFTAKYGLHNIAPEWYGGISVLKFYSPGWFYFALPLYWLTKSVQAAAYASQALMLLLAAIFTWMLGNSAGMSAAKRIAFFLLMFANAISIGSFIRLGALPTMFAWVFMIPLFCIIIWYAEHDIDWKFYPAFIALLSILILSHPQETMLAGVLVLSLFIASKDKIKILASSAAALALTAFWWYPFLAGLKSESTVGMYKLTWTLWNFSPEFRWTSLAAIAFSSGLLLTALWKWKTHGMNRKSIALFMPTGILALLVLTKLVYFVPFLNQVYVDAYILLFLMWILYMVFKIDWSRISAFSKKAVAACLIIFPILSLSFSHFYTPYFTKPSPLAVDLREILGEVDDVYLIIGGQAEGIYSRALYSYGAIYLNLTTASGWSTHEISQGRRQLLVDSGKYFSEKNCEQLTNALHDMGVRQVISYLESCSFFSGCGYWQKAQKGQACLFIVPA